MADLDLNNPLPSNSMLLLFLENVYLYSACDFYLTQSDVWIVPLSKGLEWVQDPTPIANLTSFAPFSCT